MFRYYEKESSSSKTLHQRTALEENAKQRILSNEFVRRLLNTSDGLDRNIKTDITDAQKLVNSGYTQTQARKTIINSIRGYGSKKLRCEKEERRLRRTGPKSKETRTRGKLLSKTSWY